MAIKGFYLFPHPPIVVPEVGKDEVKKIQLTYDSMDSLAKEIGEKAPKTIILISPHGTMFRDAISLLDGEYVSGDLGQFGASSVEFNKKINEELTHSIYDLAMENNISVVKADKDFLRLHGGSFKLDHGTLVPLYFIDKYFRDYNIVHITYAPLSDSELYKFGTLIYEAAQNTDAILIASGDLSHRLKDSGPYGYNPDGPVFDKKILNLLELGDVDSILHMDKSIIQNAGECGMRSILILLGALKNIDFKGQLLSYENTFGVGYGVMKFESTHINLDNPYVRLAKDNISHYLTTGKTLDKIPDYVTDKMKNEKRGVFVTLYKDGSLRGCIGTIFPTTASIYEEIIRNSIQAAIYDPRFRKVEIHELKDLVYSVDVLDSPEPATMDDLDPKNYGIILTSGHKKGLLLPNLEGVDRVEDQVKITKSKAGIEEGEKFSIERFKVTRYEENSNV